MISLRKLFGKDDKFFTLLEQSAEEARHCVQELNRVLSSPSLVPSLEHFHRSKEADKRITEQINEALVTTFISQLEREDIEVLSAALYKIPKTVEKIAERFIISAHLLSGISFAKHISLMDDATERVLEMVKVLRELGGNRLAHVKSINAKLQQIESEADRLILETLGDLFSGRHEPTKVMALKELYELLEKVIDRCRDAGNIVSHIVLKHS